MVQDMKLHHENKKKLSGNQYIFIYGVFIVLNTQLNFIVNTDLS